MGSFVGRRAIFHCFIVLAVFISTVTSCFAIKVIARMTLLLNIWVTMLENWVLTYGRRAGTFVQNALFDIIWVEELNIRWMGSLVCRLAKIVVFGCFRLADFVSTIINICFALARFRWVYTTWPLWVCFAP